MFDFDDAPVGVHYSELAEEAVVISDHLRIVSRPETRELLDRHSPQEETFRTHELDASNPRAVVGQLHTAYLIEPAGVDTGNVTDWTTTERGVQLLSQMDEHRCYITDAEADALLQVGASVWLLPEPDVWWTTADIDVDLHPREIETLESAGLVERELDVQDGYSTVWRTSERLHSIATIVWEVVTDE